MSVMSDGYKKILPLYAFLIVKYACKFAKQKVKICKIKMQNVLDKIGIFVNFIFYSNLAVFII